MNQPVTLNDPALPRGPYTLAAMSPFDDPRQKDHVSVGKGMIAGAHPHARAQTYIRTYLAAGDEISNNPQHLPQPEVDARLFDLTESFLFDVARIIATDDGKPWQMYSESAAIADLMNFYRTDIITREGPNHLLWLPGMATNTNESMIISKLHGLIAKLLLSSNPTVQKGRAALGGGAAALGAYALGGLALGPALGVGAAAGLAIWGASKLFGF